MNGVSGESDACQSRVQPDQGSLVQRLEAFIRLFDALLRQNRALRQEMAGLAEALIRASRVANYDELTGLPNRRLLQDRFRGGACNTAAQAGRVVVPRLERVQGHQ